MLQHSNVCQLIKINNREWDANVVHDIFNSRDIQHIMSIPLSKLTNSDTCYWRKEATALPPLTATDFHDWFTEVWSRHKGDGVEEILMVSWSIWKARNELLWNNRTRSTANVLSIAHNVLGQWKYAQTCHFELLHFHSDCGGSKDF
uniref:Uncharacterized protein n=1 Tax=Cannabis sativa TaxID=3483 RepID=A0A803Q7F1_CANSA